MVPKRAFAHSAGLGGHYWQTELLQAARQGRRKLRKLHSAVLVLQDTGMQSANLGSQGGHFAAVEKPDELWKDISDFVEQAWNKTTT